MSEPRFAVGQPVRVKRGVADADYPDLPLGGWAGTIIKVGDDESDRGYLLRFTDDTLRAVHPVYSARCGRDGLNAKQAWVREDDIESDSGGSLDIEHPTNIVSRPLSMDRQEDRLLAIFGLTSDYTVPFPDDDTHRQFFEHLKAKLTFPFKATYGGDDELLDELPAEPLTAVSLLEYSAAGDCRVLCKDAGGSRQWELPLRNLKPEASDPNRQLVDDYQRWYYLLDFIDDRSGGVQLPGGDDLDDEHEEWDDEWDEGDEEDLTDADYEEDDVEVERGRWPQEGPAPIMRSDVRVGRNDPCPCGSGKKFKKCCLGKTKTAEPSETAGSALLRGSSSGLSYQIRTPPAVPTDTAFRLKVTLMGSNPPIWRRFTVKDCTLETLHGVLQFVMGWGDEHLYAFEVAKKNYVGPRSSELPNSKAADTMTLGRLSEKGHTKFVYEYDFGDSWRHLVEIESSRVPEPGAEYPTCLDGARACPPEDTGGTWRYGRLLEALRDPENADHEYALERLGEDFDPEAFSAEERNNWLHPTRQA